jgi:endonuclease-3 related protein
MVVAGTILTQNTSWKNAEKALCNLEMAGIVQFYDLLSLPDGKLADLIRPSGYYAQKARTLTLLCAFLAAGGYVVPGHPPTREDLLSVRGVGPETADSILTYGYGIGSFIADSYARRLFFRLGHCNRNDSYDTVQQVLSGQIGARPCEYWNEFHALIVEHAKTLCMKKPACMRCFLRWQCAASKSSVVPWENVR